MNNLAVLVIGPESSGTRLMTRILIEVFGFAGSYEHQQPFDAILPTPDIMPRIVWHRSLPHNHEWPNIELMMKYLESSGYKVMSILMGRIPEYMEKSQLAMGHISNHEEFENNLQKANEILNEVMGYFKLYGRRYLCVPYEYLIKIGVREIVFMCLADKYFRDFEIYDGNLKYEQSFSAAIDGLPG